MRSKHPRERIKKKKKLSSINIIDDCFSKLTIAEKEEKIKSQILNLSNPLSRIFLG